MLMSCCAALQNLTFALMALGFSYRVSRFPDLSDPDLLARIDVDARSGRDIDTSALEYLLARRTVAPHEAVLPPPVGTVASVQHEMERKGATMSLISPEDMRIVLQIVEENREDVRLLAKEEAMWRHPNRVRSRDGIPGGMQLNASSFFAESEGAVFGVLVTHGDRMLSWFQGGIALESGLIAATRENLVVSLASRPLHLGHVRIKLGKALSLQGTPQIFLRMAESSGASGAPTPRRSIVDVMIHPGFTG